MALDRRTFIASLSAAICCAALRSFADETTSGPWSKQDLIDPTDLLPKINDKQLHLLCVGFPQLYRKHRIAHAHLAGPASRPDGMKELLAATEHLPKNEEIVIYCGCCPMKDCPNTRPAYAALKSAGFKNVKVLNLPRNLRLDWVEKGYPSEG